MVMVLLFVDNVIVIKDGMCLCAFYNCDLKHCLFSIIRVGERCECDSNNANSTVDNCPYVHFAYVCIHTHVYWC